MKRAFWLIAVAALAFGCNQKTSASPPPAAPTTVEEGRALFEQGQLDAALAKFRQSPGDADALLWVGRVSAKKAETAPFPTPPPAPSPIPRGYKPAQPPEFKPEELDAIAAFEQAIAAKPGHADAHLALAQLLELHAVRTYDQQQAAAAMHKRPVPASPSPSPVTGPDFSAERVAREYQAAAEGTPPSRERLEEVIRFSSRVKQYAAAEWALQQLVDMRHEDPKPIVRLGDFLLKEKGDIPGAIDRYQQALILQPDDDSSRDKLADIYIDMGADLFSKRQYSVAEAKLKQAQKYITDRSSSRAQRLSQFLTRIDEIRGN